MYIYELVNCRANNRYPRSVSRGITIPIIRLLIEDVGRVGKNGRKNVPHFQRAGDRSTLVSTCRPYISRA